MIADSTSSAATRTCRRSSSATDWDLIVCDEAHKMSATLLRQRGQVHEALPARADSATLTRHFLLLTATPHNGKEEDFQLFMALLDGDRFEGASGMAFTRPTSTDLMRRLVKEELLKFDGTPLFPERLAYTVNYNLSDAEAGLYQEVTDYVREEFNRAEALERREARRARSASRSRSSSAAWPHRPRRSTSPSAAAVNASRAAPRGRKLAESAARRRSRWSKRRCPGRRCRRRGRPRGCSRTLRSRRPRSEVLDQATAAPDHRRARGGDRDA